MDPSARHMLEIYLRDHLGGSVAGLSLVRRCRRANRGTGWDTALASLEGEIAEDRQSLEAIMSLLSVEPSPIKAGLGAVGELASRMKPNGRLFGYSPLSRLIELEALAAGIESKRNLWRALRHADEASVLDPTMLDSLIERAKSQRERVLELHDRAAADTFDPGRASVGEPL
jgi:hypothetical protein